MREQLYRGKLKFISFIFIDLICLTCANIFAVLLYRVLSKNAIPFSGYARVILYMSVIDILVTFLLNSLDTVLRRRKKRELVQCLRHVGMSLILLSTLLFLLKEGAAFSRATVYLAYVIYWVLMVGSHLVWRDVLNLEYKSRQIPTALLITTSGYAEEGMRVVDNADMLVKGLFITDKTNEGEVGNIPIIVGRRDAAAFICWEGIDKVFICGPDGIDIPENLLSACKQMGVPVYTASAKKNFKFETVKIKTVLQKNEKSTGLSFFEAEQDIPFQIRRVYSIYEKEQNNQRGFHAHKKSWHLLFCPYGSVEVIVDTGTERKTITLEDPSEGLILSPSVWREILWKKAGSVLCVAASGHYDSETLRTDYDEYLQFLREKEWAATIEFAEIMGEVAI